MEKDAKRVLIAAGGTGGHVFPAQALAKQLLAQGDEVLFMGQGLATNRYFHRDLFPSVSIDASSPFQKGSFRKLFSLFSLARGICQAFRAISGFRPSIAIGFGSFHSFPALAAAWLRGVPIVLFEPNAVPGKVNRLFSRWAVFSGVQFPEARKALKGICHEVEMPLWSRQNAALPSKKEALSYFSLEEGKLTVLVFGGSQGAASLNEIVAASLCQLNQIRGSLQVVHFTGNERFIGPVQEIYEKADLRSHVKAFESNMHLAWSAADFAVCRAGAATLAEINAFEVPAMLIPYPSAADGHQLKNALFLEKEVGGALCLEEKDLKIDAFLDRFLRSDVQKMKESIQAFKKNKSRKPLVDYIGQILARADLNQEKRSPQEI